MNRIVISGVALFLAVVGLSLLNGDREAVAGGGVIQGCSGYVVSGCSGYVGCHGCHGAVVSRGCFGSYCSGRRVRVRHHGCGCSLCRTSCYGGKSCFGSSCSGVIVQKSGPVVQKGGVVVQKGGYGCTGCTGCKGYDPCSCSGRHHCSGRIGLLARLRARHSCSCSGVVVSSCGCDLCSSGGMVVQKGGVVMDTGVVQKGVVQKGAAQK